MKTELLKILSSDPNKVFSGEQLSRQLGVSRVSVWKHIKKLRELGYDITSHPNGYQLHYLPDALFPWEFPGQEDLIHYYQETDSTMVLGKELARKGCPSFTVVIAERQTAGRGRLKRFWHSDDGGLYFTLILKLDISPVMMSRISFAASLSLTKVLRDEFGIDARVKWPNDILIDERKLCGMLCEMEMESDRVAFLNISIGINVNNNPREKVPNAVSIKELVGRDIPRKEILGSFLKQMKQELSHSTLDHIIPLWKTYTISLNRRVKIVTTSGEYEGLAVDVDENGALLLEQPDKEIKKVYYGDCFHLAS